MLPCIVHRESGIVSLNLPACDTASSEVKYANSPPQRKPEVIPVKYMLFLTLSLSSYSVLQDHVLHPRFRWHSCLFSMIQNTNPPERSCKQFLFDMRSHQLHFLALMLFFCQCFCRSHRNIPRSETSGFFLMNAG